MVSESDWIRLTPKLVRGEPPDTIAEYGKRALSPYCHLLRNVRQDGPMRVRDDGALEFSSAELAAIPIVKALVETADFAQRTMNEYGNATNWPPDMPMEYATAINKLRDAVVFWKEATDGEGD